ncbi:glutamate-5-semialdehyde dehydrogenase [Candidatus Gastranaerophilus sp. (ex Termes propinquus)]|nr:glutamate-5-semialdehyde dehydrogenase [Candidatus Gastranaerophilus sp. (ex Termes propinquus)]
MTQKTDVKQIAKNAREAALLLARSSVESRNEALLNIAKHIESQKEEIFQANRLDLNEAESLVKSGDITQATYSRLKLDENKMRDMLAGIQDVVKLEDPINEVFWRKKLDDDLILEKISCPIGVIGVIFEARPDVIAQISSLALKSGNAVLLKGGRESHHTNTLIARIINEAIPFKGAISLLESREDVARMLKLDQFINLIIPRGSNELVQYIQNNTKIPVLGHASGICHIYVDAQADFEMAKNICIDAKTQYPSACLP